MLQRDQRMTRYRAFGLEIDTDLDLDELAVGSEVANPDLRIMSAPPRATRLEASDEATIRVDAESVQIAFAGVASFALHPSQDLIKVEPVAGAEALVSLPLLGPVLALWLHLKGDLVLHASAVAWSDGAYALIGAKGAGKSTTAAALLAQGGRLVTDDLLRLRWSGARAPLCEPAYAQLKLTEASSEVFAPQRARALASPHPAFAKQRWRLEGELAAAEPLRMVCSLTRGPRLKVEPFAPADALRVCLDEVFVRRYGAAVLSRELAARQFAAATKLVNAVTVVKLTLPDNLPALEEAGVELMSLLEAMAN